MGTPLSQSPTFRALKKQVDEIEVPLLPRFVVNVQLVAGHLIITFSDGSVQDIDLGVLIPSVPDMLNTLISSTLPFASVQGATVAFNSLNSTADEQDARLDQLEAA